MGFSSKGLTTVSKKYILCWSYFSFSFVRKAHFGWPGMQPSSVYRATS